MRRVPIRIKLLGALAVPLLGLLSIIVVELTQASRDAREVRTQTDLATATIGPAGVLSSLQEERSWAVAHLAGADKALTLGTKGYPETRANTDEALATFRSEIERSGGDVAAVYRPALDGLGKLTALRQEIDAHLAGNPQPNMAFSDGVFDRYAELTGPFLDANSRLALAIDNPGLRQGAELIDLSSRQIETLADLSRALIQGGLSGAFEQRIEFTRIAALSEAFRNNAEAIKESKRAPYRDLIEDGFPEKVTADLLKLADMAIAGGKVTTDQVLAVLNVPLDRSYTGFRSKAGSVLADEADRLQSDATNRGWVFRLFALVAVAVAGMATWWVSRSITRPLRALTRQATDMANHRLPDAVLDILDTPLGDDVTVPQVEPITVQTRDEVADVAEALNTVQDSALDLAVEQAVLRRNIADSFVNLGRRNQNLLGRQLDFITELEHNETDPDTLANLFRLDHLATRMRRNAESLLVLAGIDPPRKWAAPVRITDAIRAALGEVEDYQRVTVRAVEATTIMGSAAADLAHLLAELIENALIFSPPDQTVEIRGRTQPAGYTLAIIDSGLGMPPDELARANRRLAGAESFTIAPSKYLGHYVAGNLAARHNINVTLHNSPGHGITATINLPPTLLTTESATGEVDTAPGAPELTSEFIPRAEDVPPVARRANGKPPVAPREPAALASLDELTADEPVLDPLMPVLDTTLEPVLDAPLEAVPEHAETPDYASALAGDAELPGVADQTLSGLAKRSHNVGGQAAIPTRPDRPKPPGLDDDLIRTLEAYTTGLHKPVTDLPPTAPQPVLPSRDHLAPPPAQPPDLPATPQRRRLADQLGSRAGSAGGAYRDDRDRSYGPDYDSRTGGPLSRSDAPTDNPFGPDLDGPLGPPLERPEAPAGRYLAGNDRPSGRGGPGGPLGDYDRPRGPGGPGSLAGNDRPASPGPLGDYDRPGGPGAPGAPGALGDYDRPTGPPLGGPGGSPFDSPVGPPLGGPDAPAARPPFDSPVGPPLGGPDSPAARSPYADLDSPLGPPLGGPDAPRGRGRRPDAKDPLEPAVGTPPPIEPPSRGDRRRRGATPPAVGGPHFADNGGAPAAPPVPITPPPLDNSGRPAPPPGGLQKRVRGAQMPTTEPLNLRRGGGRQGPPSRETASSRPAARPPQGEPPEPNGDHRAADEVYGFLSSFSAGVQRGLDEARRRGRDD